MSNVVSFLERMGRDARLREASIGDLEAAMIEASLDPASRTAILDRDRADLESLLRVEKNVCCMVYPVDGAQ